ncbi:MAG: hypothetical protein WD600_03890, partial [Pseudohongiella sp.]
WHMQAFASGQSDSRLAELETAYRLYSEAIRLSGAYYGNADPQLPELLYNLASVAYLFAGNYQERDGGSVPVLTSLSGTRLDSQWHPERASYGYMQGRRALEGVVSLHSEKQADDTAALVDARLALADWHEAFGYNRRAETERSLALEVAATLSPAEYDQRVVHRTPAPWKESLRNLSDSVPLT